MIRSRSLLGGMLAALLTAPAPVTIGATAGVTPNTSGLWIEGHGLTVSTGNNNLPSTDDGGIHLGMPFAKNQASSGGYGTFKIFSNDPFNPGETYLQAYFQLYTDPTANNRRLRIECVEQGTASRVITLNENALDGRVVVGTSTWLGYTFQISADQTGSAQFIMSGRSNTNQQLLIGYDTTNDYATFDAVKQGTGYKDINLQRSGGNVGVGTVTGTAKLNVKQADGSNAVVVSGATKGVRFVPSSSNVQIEGVDNTGLSSFQPLVIGGSQVTITNSGNTVATFASALVTFAQPLTTVASATGASGLNIPHGAAPTSPANGDMWTTTSGLFVRINGVTKTVTLT